MLSTPFLQYSGHVNIMNTMLDNLANKFTNNIMSVDNVKHLLQNYEILKHSVCMNDVGLLFTVAKTLFIKYDPETIFVSILLSIPLAFQNNVAPLYRITNFFF